jgi:carbon monoxide dehydrogenase subunit G
MRFENSFEAPATADDVYQAMLDIKSVAECLPGATVGEQREDGAYEATIAVKVGPIRLTYGGTVTIADRDDDARVATLVAEAREQRGQGTARATIAMQVEPQEPGSKTLIGTDLSITGRVAQMGQGIMQEVANSMIDQFAGCLAQRLAAPVPVAAAPAVGGEEPQPAAPPHPAQPVQQEVHALPLIFKAMWRRIRHPHR